MGQITDFSGTILGVMPLQRQVATAPEGSILEEHFPEIKAGSGVVRQ